MEASSVEVPSYFLCPISLEIMRDPVTLPTGITYDRQAIERWLFSDRNGGTCPITRQPLLAPDSVDDLTPNHTLRRLIQAWCAVHAADGVERFPTPRQPVDRSHISSLLRDAHHSPDSSLRRLKAIVSESDRNRRCVESSPGAVDFLASVVKGRTGKVADEALSVLHSIRLSDKGLLALLNNHEDFVQQLTEILRQSTNYQSRAYATLIIKSLLSVASPVRLAGVKDELFEEMVRVLKDRISHQATKAALKALGGLCASGRNRAKAAEAGAVGVLVELLLDEPERKACEMMLVVLDRLCECAEGRAELVGHAAGIAVVAKKLVRVSMAASERAVRVVHSLCKFSATAAVLQEMLQVGVVSKLCLLVQVDCGNKTKERVKEILRLHSKVWRSSPCISPQLLGSFPC